MAQAAARAARRAAELAPHDPEPAYRAAFMLSESGAREAGAAWAARAIANNRQARMDPLVGLSDEQLLRLRRVFPEVFSDGRALEGGDAPEG